MRACCRGLLIVMLLVLAGGPLLAAPVSLHSSPAIGTASSPAASPLARVLPWLALPFALGAIRIKDTGSLAKKFVQRAGAAQGDYKSGVEAAGQDWETNTKNSEENYKIGVTQAANDGRFGRGVAAAGAAKFVTRAASLGAQRYPTGVGAAEGDWARGTQPYLDALKGMDLPPRRPKGDPGNQARANAVAMKLRAMRVGK